MPVLKVSVLEKVGLVLKRFLRSCKRKGINFFACKQSLVDNVGFIYVSIN